MRMLMKVSIPVESGNAAAKKGVLGSTIQRLVEEQKPESAYFLAEDNGERTGYFVLNMKDSSEIPGLAEPWFLAFNARITLRPVMNAQDLANGAPGMERAVKAFSASV
jgi:hypothetical protein